MHTRRVCPFFIPPLIAAVAAAVLPAACQHTCAFCVHRAPHHACYLYVLSAHHRACTGLIIFAAFRYYGILPTVARIVRSFAFVHRGPHHCGLCACLPNCLLPANGMRFFLFHLLCRTTTWFYTFHARMRSRTYDSYYYLPVAFGRVSVELSVPPANACIGSVFCHAAFYLPLNPFHAIYSPAVPFCCSPTVLIPSIYRFLSFYAVSAGFVHRLCYTLGYTTEQHYILLTLTERPSLVLHTHYLYNTH